MLETENHTGEPWKIFCKTCGWVLFAISWETVRIDISAALKSMKETRVDLTRLGQEHHRHELIVIAPGSPDQD